MREWSILDHQHLRPATSLESNLGVAYKITENRQESGRTKYRYGRRRIIQTQKWSPRWMDTHPINSPNTSLRRLATFRYTHPREMALQSDPNHRKKTKILASSDKRFSYPHRKRSGHLYALPPNLRPSTFVLSRRTRLQWSSTSTPLSANARTLQRDLNSCAEL